MFEGLTFTCIVLLLYFSKFNLQINIAYPYMVHLLHQLDFIVSKFGSVQSSGLNKQVPFFFLFFFGSVHINIIRTVTLPLLYHQCSMLIYIIKSKLNKELLR